MTATVHPLRNRMSDDEFDRRWKAIVDTYGMTTKEAIAKRDRETAMFLADSGWGQAEIAARIGRSQRWVSCHLIFGDFLAYHNVVDANLTESVFRKFWLQTLYLDTERRGSPPGRKDGALRIADREATPARYAEVARLLKEGDETPKLPLSFVEQFADGKFHRADKMADDAEMSVDDFIPAMRRLSHSGSKKFKIESKQVGQGTMYRVFRNADAVSPAEMRAKLKPYLEELKDEGRKDHIALASLKNVLRLATLIERQIESWEQGE